MVASTTQNAGNLRQWQNIDGDSPKRNRLASSAEWPYLINFDIKSWISSNKF
jgi:hypothetical protein